MGKQRQIIPNATYRIQFSPAFDFAQACEIIGYLSDLGISHLYASPYLQSVSGSTHGYDVVDPGRINTELGGEEGHRNMCGALNQHDMGQVLDIVPNHMAISSLENAWWRDVLENGRAGIHARYFDVDWSEKDSRFGNKVLLPILGDQYGRVLEKGEIMLERRDEIFFVRYFEHTFPMSPRSVAIVLHKANEHVDSDELGFFADTFAELPQPTSVDARDVARRHRNKELAKRQVKVLLNYNDIREAVDRVINEINGDIDVLDELLGEQNYRLAYWRTARQDIGYRRFFDINSLVGLRVEDEIVFYDTHKLILKWLKNGTLDGVRIDHPDGLREPLAYFERLHAEAPHSWIVVEKILTGKERLRSTWPVQGTTGYDFLNAVSGVLVNDAAAGAFTELYVLFTKRDNDYVAEMISKKKQVVDELFSADLGRAANLFVDVCERHRRHRDHSYDDVYEALKEVLVHFPVYRTYVDPVNPVDSADYDVINDSFSQAAAATTAIGPDLFDFIRSVLLKEIDGDLESSFVMLFQQITGPVAAKGVEDTLFYSFNRFVALNEVGGEPQHFGLGVDDFHEFMIDTAKHRPAGMLSTSTHDTKRSEDVRARLAVLSEIPEQWSEAVHRWSAIAEKYKSGGHPDNNTEYFFYQNLVGAWPVDMERMSAYMEKAAREAKEQTNWIKHDEEYEAMLRRFVQGMMSDDAFLKDVADFIEKILHSGRINALSQKLIALTAPGIPDLYQGTELWHYYLVDPDNRQAVDFDRRKQLLQEIQSLQVEDIMQRMDEGLPKMWLIRQALNYRKLNAACFLKAGYEAMAATGEKADHVIAFMRDKHCITIVPRLNILRGEGWGDTSFTIPQGRWLNQMTGDEVEGASLNIGEVLQRFPVALLTRKEEA